MDSQLTKHPLFSRFRLFQGYIAPGFEAWFYGVKVQDWLFTGTSKKLRGGPVAVGHPPVNSEYFEWLALMAGVVSAHSRFTMVECGAGWGRWLAAGAQLARQRNLSLCLVGVEAEPSHFEWMETVLNDNGIAPGERTLHRCAVAPSEKDVLFLLQERPAENYGQQVVAAQEAKRLRGQAGYSIETVRGRTLSGIMTPIESADLVSVDIRSQEYEVVEEALPLLREKARILQVCTNTEQAHTRLGALLEREGWLAAFRFPPFRDTETPHGNVHFDQGLQVWINPKSRIPLDLIEQGGVEAPYRVSRVPDATQVWIEVGANLGLKTFDAADRDPALRVYGFEPDLSKASQLMGRLPNYVAIPMMVGLEEGATRLDSFLDGMGIKEVEYLKIDTPGAEMAVVRSAGKRLGDIRKVSVHLRMGDGDSETDETGDFFRSAGFELVSIGECDDGREEDVMFVRARDRRADEDGRLLERARSLAAFWPPVPDPGWHFDSGWNSGDVKVQERRAIWEHFYSGGRLGPLDVEWLDALKITLYLGNDLSRQLFVLGRFEPNEFALLDRLLKPGMSFVDAGANEGLYSLFAAVRVGSSGSVWAFEPSPREFARLRGNCRRNCLDQVRAFRLALSDTNGSGELAVAVGQHAGQNALSGKANGVSVLRRERVQLGRLDDLARGEGLTRLDVLKIDVEGEEFRALRGGEHTIREHRPVILFECSDETLSRRGSSASELKNLLRDWGYQLHGFDATTGEPVPLERDNESPNLVAVPEAATR